MSNEHLKDLLKNHKMPKGMLGDVMKAWRRQKDCQRVYRVTLLAGTVFIFASLVSFLLLFFDRRPSGA